MSELAASTPQKDSAALSSSDIDTGAPYEQPPVFFDFETLAKSEQESPWGGRLAVAHMAELSLPVIDKTKVEQSVPDMVGGMMQFTRVMQETVLAVMIPEIEPPRELQNIPIAGAAQGPQPPV